MHPHDEAYADHFSVALQVAAINALHGLLRAESELNPEVEGICCVLGADGTFELTATDATGRPVGGFRV